MRATNGAGRQFATPSRPTLRGSSGLCLALLSGRGEDDDWLPEPDTQPDFSPARANNLTLSMESNRELLLTPDADFAALPESRWTSLLADAPTVAREMLTGGLDERPDATVVIQNVAAIMAGALRAHSASLVSEGISGLAQIWTVGDSDAMYPTRTPDFEASLWEITATELYALGGLAMIWERWSEARELV